MRVAPPCRPPSSSSCASSYEHRRIGLKDIEFGGRHRSALLAFGDGMTASVAHFRRKSNRNRPSVLFLFIVVFLVSALDLDLCGAQSEGHRTVVDSDEDNPGLLASTLFTFQDYACDNEQLRIRCPRGSTISVRWAQYGRLATSANNDLCPAVTWQPLPARRDSEGGSLTPSPRTDWVAMTTVAPDSLAMNSKMTSYNRNSSSEKITCLAPASLQVVVELCDERQECHIKVNHQLFRQDPCPHIGKYVEVAYQCKPAVLQTLVACKGDELKIRCPKSRHIAVEWVTYGYSHRQSSENKCQSGPAFDTECEAACSLPVVARACHGRQRCSVTADETAFGRPCRPGTSEYLTVVFACVAERTLMDLPGKVLAAIDPDECRALVVSLGISAAGTESSTRAPLTTASPESTSASAVVAVETVQLGVAAVFRHVIDTFITDWIHVCHYMSENFEKFILYAVLGLCVGLICVLLVIIVKLVFVISGLRKRRDLAVEPSTHRRLSHKTDGSTTGPGATPAEPSFVDSGRGSPSLAAGGLRRSTPELSRRGPTSATSKSSRQRRRPSPFDFPSPSSGGQTPGFPAAAGASTSGPSGGVHLPPGPDSPVFVHVESPRESPLLGRAPPTREVTSSESAGPTPPPRTAASASAVANRSVLRAPISNEFSRRPEWFRPSTPGSSAASRTDLRQRGESPIWIRRSSAEPDEEPPISILRRTGKPSSVSSHPAPGSQTGSDTHFQTPVGNVGDDDDDAMTVVVPVMPASSPEPSGPPLPPAWIDYLNDYEQTDPPRTTSSAPVDVYRPVSTTSSTDVIRSYSPQYRPLSGTASSTPRTRGYSSSSASSLSPTSTMLPPHNFYTQHPHLAAASTIPRSSGNVLGPRRAAAVYPSSASLGPVPSVMIADLASNGPGGPSSFSVASQGDATDGEPTLTRSFSNPFRQDTYLAPERRPTTGRTSPATSSHRYGSRSSSSSGRRRRHFLRFE